MRQKLFSGDNVFFRLMGKIGDFMCLNFLFLLSCLPVVTAGAAVSALYEVLYDISLKKDGGCFRKYIRAFRKLLGRAAAYWIICLFLAVFLILGISGVRLMDGGVRIFFQAVSVVLILLWTGALSFGLVLISRTDFSVKETFRNAVLVTVGSFPQFILNVLITCLPVLFFLKGGRLIVSFFMPLFALFGIPLVGYVKMHVYRQVLKKYGFIKEEEENDSGESAHLSDRAVDGHGEEV